MPTSLHDVREKWDPPTECNRSRRGLEFPYYFESHLAPSGFDLTSGGGRKLGCPWRQEFMTWILSAFPIGSFALTVLFAWNANSGQHADTRFLFQDPGRTILVLQVLTNITTICMAELAMSAYEAVHPSSCDSDLKIRWAMATRGTRLSDFIALSRSTAFYGQMCLLFGPNTHR
jgi:hypothetical protein